MNQQLGKKIINLVLSLNQGKLEEEIRRIKEEEWAEIQKVGWMRYDNCTQPYSAMVSALRHTFEACRKYATTDGLGAILTRVVEGDYPISLTIDGKRVADIYYLVWHEIRDQVSREDWVILRAS